MKNSFAKSISIILFLIFAAVNFSAQTICEPARTNAALLLNLQLKMSPEQVQNVFGKALKIRVKKDGEYNFFQNYIKKPAPAPLKNVRALYLRFFDKRLYQIEIFYEPRPDLPTLETLTNLLSEQLSFPAENWKIKNRYAEIACGDNRLKADNILNPHIELTDEIVLKIVKEARKKKK